MQYFIAMLATIACAAAAPGYLLAQEPDYLHLPLGKSTFTSSSQTVDHGSTHVIHSLPVVHTAPVVHAAPVVHTAPLVQVPTSISTQSHERTSYHAPAAKTTVTNSKQVVNHGGTSVYHAPVVSSVALHSSPLVYHSSPLVAYKTPDSAFSQHSSTIHETLPVVNSVPLYSLH